jgi:uncharacterized protein YjbJ (UPF0337 family)
MNDNFIQGKWREIKGEIKRAWGKLTDDEIEKTKGDMTSIGGLIQQRYGEKEESYRQKLSDIFDRYKDEKDDAVQNVKDRLKKTS